MSTIVTIHIFQKENQINSGNSKSRSFQHLQTTTKKQPPKTEMLTWEGGMEVGLKKIQNTV